MCSSSMVDVELMDEQKLISVVISSYQSADTLSRAVCSVLNQSYPTLEVIVVDNGSTDNTHKVIVELVKRDIRVRPVRLEQNQRPAGGRNAGVENSNGDYIAFLDADDEWLPDKLESQVWALDTQPQAGVVISDGWVIDEHSGTRQLYSDTYQTYFKRLSPREIQPGKRLFWLDVQVRETIYEKCFINTSSIVLRKNLFTSAGGFDTRRFGPEDVDLWVRLAKRTGFVYLNKPVVNRYVSTNNLSAVSEFWLLELLSYHKDCYSSAEYADLMPLIKKNLDKYFRILIFFYGRERLLIKAWKMVFDSLHYGFFPVLPLYAALAPFGGRGYDLGLRVKDALMKMANRG
jgi:glycosyltransferase involved in cell wall biosynthesis